MTQYKRYVNPFGFFSLLCFGFTLRELPRAFEIERTESDRFRCVRHVNHYCEKQLQMGGATSQWHDKGVIAAI
jgi:hypothetical protein